ncbi:MAG TPA: hypothetical protein VF721_01295 [Pyrinomonadaceae bacterium]|jgi:hypothetical protein
MGKTQETNTKKDVKSEKIFTQDDFQNALKKVSRKVSPEKEKKDLK